MPGLVAILGHVEPQAARASVRTMLARLKHESFYTTGEFADEEMGVYCGWALRGGSFADCLPVWNGRRDVCVLLSGEIHPPDDMLARLRAAGHRFESGTAAFLAALFEERGSDCLPDLNGWFNGLVIDRRDRTVTAFNDRYGMSRVHVAEADGAVYLANEAKALLAARPELRRFDPRGLAEYFSTGCALGNGTLFEGIRLLPPASKWTFREGRLAARESYFDPREWTEQEPLPAAEYHDALRETFAGVLPRYMEGGRERVAISLTGGVDSRMVMAWARTRPGALPCYTFGGMYRDCGDVRIARAVARVCGQQHTTIGVGDEFLRRFPELAERTVFLTDGAMDVSAAPDLYANAFAREIAPVRMTGNYGGEILRSIVAFRPGRLPPAMYEPGFARLVADVADRYRDEGAVGPLPFVAFKQVPWHHHSRLSLELSQLTLRSPYLDNDLVRLAFRVPPELAMSNELALRIIAEGNPALARIPTDRGLLLKKTPIVTLVQNAFQEFTFRAEYAYDYGMPQALVRVDDSLRALHLERLFLGRHKFYHFRYWYRHALAPFVREVLLDPRSLGRSHVNPAVVNDLVTRHTTGAGNHTLEIHRLLSIELATRQLLEAA